MANIRDRINATVNKPSVRERAAASVSNYNSVLEEAEKERRKRIEEMQKRAGESLDSFERARSGGGSGGILSSIARTPSRAMDWIRKKRGVQATLPQLAGETEEYTLARKEEEVEMETNRKALKKLVNDYKAEDFWGKQKMGFETLIKTIGAHTPKTKEFGRLVVDGYKESVELSKMAKEASDQSIKYSRLALEAKDDKKKEIYQKFAESYRDQLRSIREQSEEIEIENMTAAQKAGLALGVGVEGGFLISGVRGGLTGLGVGTGAFKSGFKSGAVELAGEGFLGGVSGEMAKGGNDYLKSGAKGAGEFLVGGGAIAGLGALSRVGSKALKRVLSRNPEIAEEAIKSVNSNTRLKRMSPGEQVEEIFNIESGLKEKALKAKLKKKPKKKIVELEPKKTKGKGELVAVKRSKDALIKAYNKGIIENFPEPQMRRRVENKANRDKILEEGMKDLTSVTDVVFGKKPPKEGIHIETYENVARTIAYETENIDLINRLALESKVNLEASDMGSRLNALREESRLSTKSVVDNVVDYKKKNVNSDIIEADTKQVNNVKKEAFKVEKAQEVLNNLICKNA